MEVTQSQITEQVQRSCNKCKAPCCLGNFKQVVGLKGSGLMIYVPKDTKYVEKKSQGKIKKHFFILHNASDRMLRRPDYIKEMCQYRTKCVQCKDFIHEVRNLVDEITDIKQDEVIGVCDYCTRRNPCKRCEYFVNKFKCCQTIQKQEKRALFMCWLNKVNGLLQRILEYKNILTNRFSNESPPYMNEFLELLQALKPFFDVDLLDKSLLPKMMEYAKDVKILEDLEDQLTGTSALPRMLKYNFYTKHSGAENDLIAFKHILTKNKEQLEELLFKLKHDIDVKLLSKMLEYAGSTEGKTRFGQSSSIEYLANNKKMLVELLNISDKKLPDTIINSKEILPSLKMKIDELNQFSKKNNLSKKLIRSSISEKLSERNKVSATAVNKNKKESHEEKQERKMQKSGSPKRGDFATDKDDKLEGKQYKKEGLNRKKGKKHTSKDSDSIDSVTGLQKKGNDDKHELSRKKDYDSKKLRAKSRNLAENDKAQKLSMNKNKLHDLSSRGLKDELHNLNRKYTSSKKLRDKSRIQYELAGNDKREKLTVNKNKLYGDSPSEIKRFLKDQKDRRKKVSPFLSARERTKKVASGDMKSFPLYTQHEFKDLDQTNLSPVNTIITTDAYDDLERPYRITNAQQLLSKSRKNGGFLYQLSDREYIEKGWTILPELKTMRRIFIYKMEPALPQYNWFENNKNEKMLFYESGEKMAEIDDDGSGRWYYRNGEVALDYYSADEDSEAGQRCVVYSCGGDVDMGKASPRTVLASFDYRGNGVVYDRYGNERLKYNQFEGVLRDEKIGPTSRWKWNPLNEPPILRKIEVDNDVKRVDPGFDKVIKHVKDDNNPRTSRSERQRAQSEIVAMEYEKYIRRNRPVQKFQIRMKALKLNDSFSLRIFDQSKIYLLFRDGCIKQKFNVGMNLLNEVIETDMVEPGDVMTRYDVLPPLSDSLADIQKTVQNVRKVVKERAEKTDRLLRPPKLSASAYKVGIGIKE